MSDVVVSFKSSGDVRHALSEVLGGVATLSFLDDSGEAERGRLLDSADVLLCGNYVADLSQAEREALTNVRLIQLMSAGANRVPFADLPTSILIAGNVGAYAKPMAEHALAMILHLSKHLGQEHQKLVLGDWDRSTINRSIAGMTAGILGFGGIGQSVAKVLAPLGVTIAAINSTGQTEHQVEFIGTLANLEYVLRRAQIVVVCLPLNKHTNKLLGAQELDWMGSDAILINVARGALINERALYEHARDNPEFLVGLDVWWGEPFRAGTFQTEFPLLQLANVIGSPHNSGHVPGVDVLAVRHAAENVGRFLATGTAKGIVRREDYI